MAEGRFASHHRLGCSEQTQGDYLLYNESNGKPYIATAMDSMIVAAAKPIPRLGFENDAPNLLKLSRIA